MAKQRIGYLLIAAFFISLFGLAACSTSDKDQAQAVSTSGSASNTRRSGQKSPAVASDNTRRGQDRSSLDSLRRGESSRTPADSPLREVYFAFDSYELSTASRATLRASADWLKNNPAARVEIEGHCDERGTSEYNLALGAKRAQAAKDYLVTLGVPVNRLSTVSYGEEIPVCRDHSESCWQKNRRDRFVHRGKTGTM